MQTSIQTMPSSASPLFGGVPATSAAATSTIAATSLSYSDGKIHLVLTPTTWSTGTNTINFSVTFDSMLAQYADVTLVGGGALSAQVSATGVGLTTTISFLLSASTGTSTGAIDVQFKPVTQTSQKTLTTTLSGLTINSQSASTLTNSLDMSSLSMDTTAPTLLSANKSDSPSGNLVFTFSEFVQRGTGMIDIRKTDGTLVESFNAASSSKISIANQILNIDPTKDFEYNTNYDLYILADTIKDLAGNGYSGTKYSFSFKSSTPEPDPSSQVIINATTNSDALLNAPTNDVIDAGVGLDTLRYAGKAADYLISAASPVTTVATRHGEAWEIDKLTNVERILFDDKALALDLDANAGQAYRLYQAAFDRKPDVAGLGWQIKAIDNGATLKQISENFINSAEFQSLYGTNPSNSQLITLLYNNVLHRAPEQAGYDHWMNILDTSQLSRAEVLYYFSESTENQAQVLGSIQNGIEYTYFS